MTEKDISTIAEQDESSAASASKVDAPAVGTPSEDVPHDGAPDLANEALPTKTKRASLLEREGEVAA